jgi:arylsulfatase A-like enzyme
VVRAGLILTVALGPLGATLAGACGHTNDAPPGAVSPRVAPNAAVSDGRATTSSPAPAAAAQSPSAAKTVAVKPATPPHDANVVLITIDSLRADMPWTGYSRPIAPRLTEIASKAVVYTHAYAVSSYTSMSLGGLLGGKYPSEMKRDGYFFGTYTKDNVLFPEVLQTKGVKTLSAHGHGYFKNAGFEQGFDVWELVPNLKWNNTTDENVSSPQLFALAEKHLSSPELDSKRFFAWYHFLDPHDKYLPHDGISYGKGLRDRYDAEVTFTDTYVGKLLDLIAAKPWGARTIVIVSSDHGEAFGEHGQYAHGFELWENLVRVPLLVVAPGVAPRRVDAVRSQVDLARTILDFFGAEAPADMRGTSLVPEIYGADQPAREAFLDLPPTSDNDRRRALVSNGKKIISFGSQGIKRVFDLEADPGEATGLKGDAIKEPLQRFDAMDKAVVEIPATKCKEGCLNGAYLKKDGGT